MPEQSNGSRVGWMLREWWSILRLLPGARRHCRWVQSQLRERDVLQLKAIDMPFSLPKAPPHVLARSYFWAARTAPRVRCLARSLALFQRLRAQGLNAQHHMGVMREQGRFSAHAWVSLDAQPLRENPRNLSQFREVRSAAEASHDWQ